MPDNTRPKDIKQKRMILQATFLLAAATGMYALWSIARIPGEETHAVFLGFSVERLVLFGALLVATLWAGGQVIKSWLDPAGFNRFSEKILDKLANPRVYGSLLIICFWGIFNGSNFIIILAEIVEPVTLAYYLRLEPVVMWGTSLCGVTLTSAYLLRFGFSLHPFESKFRRMATFGLVFGTFLWIWIWISLSGYGIRAIDQGIGWMPLGIPLLETQVFLAWGIAMVFLSVWNWLSEYPDRARWGQVLQKEGVICVLIWLAAFVLWMAQPLKANWFASEPRPPNFVFNPNSDSSVYDISALNLLLGEGFKSRGLPFAIRPLYVIILALFHKLGGLSYEPVIWMQVVVLALIPVFLDLITKRLHNRVTAVLAAVLITLRESNAIFLGDRFSDAHAKLLMPFLPTTLGVLIFIWIMILWLQDSSKRFSLTLIAGGIVGMFMLIRPAFGVLLPFVGLAALFQLGNRRAEWGRGMILAA
ncbi:MAG: glycosyltransferase family 39 protein, partial [Anaerolineales bacterium]|nr:glycosyltransferase family 39 protein [Anaerolineales bacterium]